MATGLRRRSAPAFRGNKKFNVASLVEAADTPPFFHNNSAATIEDAVHFYTTTTFSATRAQFVLSDAQVNQIAAFLRALNALENIRSSNRARAGGAGRGAAGAADDQGAGHPRDRGRDRGARGDWADQIALYPTAVALLEEALDLEEDGKTPSCRALRNALLRQAIALKEQARDDILPQ